MPKVSNPAPANDNGSTPAIEDFIRETQDRIDALIATAIRQAIRLDELLQALAPTNEKK